MSIVWYHWKRPSRKRKMASWYDPRRTEQLKKTASEREQSLVEKCRAHGLPYVVTDQGEVVVYVSKLRLRYRPASGTARVGNEYRYELTPTEALRWFVEGLKCQDSQKVS